MPVTIYPSTLKIKDTNGTFHGADCIKGDIGPQGIPGNDYVLTTRDKSEIAELVNTSKADKVENATAGNLAALDEYGNLIDSGKGPDDIANKAPAIINSVSGAIVSFQDGAEKPVESLVIGIEPVQDLHGYNNPWPAGGGINKTSYNTDHVTTTGNTATVNLFTLDLTEGLTYTFSCKQSANLATSTRNTLAIKPDGGSTIYENTDTNYNPVNFRHVLTFTATVSGTYTFMYWGHTLSASITLSEWQVEIGSSFTSYAPYSNICPITGWTGAKVYHSGADMSDPDEIDITFPSEAGTIYGGTLDVTNGTLTINRKYMVFDGSSDEVWKKESINIGTNFYISIPDARVSNYAGYDIMCNVARHRTVGADYYSNECFLSYSNNFNLSIGASIGISSVDDFMVWLSSNNVQLVYWLATPQIYQFTSQEVVTLLGSNRIWADCGNMAVDYCADTKMYVDGAIPNVPVQEVQVNGTSILSNGVANMPLANSTNPGVIKVANETYGLRVTDNGVLVIRPAYQSEIKAGAETYLPLAVNRLHDGTFYGLAKAAGDTTQASSSNAVGVYTETARSKIHEMLDAPVTVSGRDPVIAGKAGIRYICGECDTLTLTPPASGIVDVVFTSGTTPTVLTAPSSVKWPGWFDPTSLDASVTYEINIMDGVYGAVMAWT